MLMLDVEVFIRNALQTKYPTHKYVLPSDQWRLLP